MSRFAPLEELLHGRERVLVLHDDATAGVAAGLASDAVVVKRLGEDVERPGRAWQVAVLLVADATSLRCAPSLLRRYGGARNLGVWVDSSDRILSPTPSRQWPAVTALQARLLASGAAFTRIRLARPAPTHRLLGDFCRAVVDTRAVGTGGLHVANADHGVPPHPVPGALPLPDEVSQADDHPVVPPDVILGDLADAQPVAPVTGRPPAVVSQRTGPVGPLDEALLNPRGYRPAEHDVAELTANGELRDPDGATLAAVGADGGVTPVTVEALRPYRGVEVLPSPHEPAAESAARARTVAGLAMAGVPVHGAGLAGPVDELLGPRLRAALAEKPDLGEPLARDEYSVGIRRAALLEHSTRGWYARLAKAAGLPPTPWPTISVLLCSKRPHQLQFALRQIARQRDVPIELVLATHGYEADLGRIRSVLGDIPGTVMDYDADVPFGDVLAGAARHASGAVLVKMDDDDWYGPDFLTDLLLARHHSGADLVGTTAEFVYVEELDRTIRRNDESERDADFVAGGSMMLDAAYLADVGGFRSVQRYVDAQLLHAVRAAGGSIYRTHGLGYVMRRSADGHTWSPGTDYFLNEERVGETWEGFRPSRHLQADPLDEPQPAGAGAGA